MKKKYLSLWATTLFAFAFLLSSCQKELNETIPNPSATTRHDSAGAKARASAPAPTLYIVQKGTLYAVSPQTLTHPINLGGGYAGTAPSMVTDLQSLYAIQGGKLWQVNRFTGQYKQVGYGNWTGAVGLTGAPLSGLVYAQQGDLLWKIDLFGFHRPLGGTGWAGTKAVFRHRSSLYVVWQDGFLYKVNTTNGDYQKLTAGWGNVKAIAAVYGLSDFIYIMEGNNLWEVDIETGKARFVQGGFQNTTAMTGVDGHLFIASNNVLHKVDTSGKVLITNLHWSGITSLGGYSAH
ncbi:hypothetical protein [Larkinella soli]|uniref:hypothetical protein n=1 Tax=Larkinella soli TaxID=1770527 RepID=UPI000FFC9D63|nr:hypothetical protein [Larkinella soli]